MHAATPDMLRVDLVSVLDHVHERHRVAAPEAEVGLEPVHDDAGLGGWVVVPSLVGERDELARGLAGLFLDVVKICLKRHRRA